MKVVGAIATALLGAASVKASGVDMTPVSRVVELLKSIAKQTEEENKAEEALYKKFVCWAKTVIDTKTGTNAAAKERITSLETYIADIEAGRIEFTTERVDLEKALEEINSAIEAATAMREKEHEEFLGAEDEMVKATTALDKAILVLKEATANHQEGVFLENNRMSATTEGFAARAHEAKDLAHAVELGEKVLTKGDAIFLRRLLSGEVPERADWKTLNRKATFKMDYKARSGKIQEVLAKLQQTVTINLEDARAKEEKAQTDFDALMEAKNAEKEKTEEALSAMESENGARGMNKEQAQDEVDSLKTQVENDTKYIEQTEASLAEKKEEWKARQKLRAGEQAAIAKAISILHSDDARDNFKKSFESQGYSLMQVAQKSGRSRGERAAAMLRQSLKATKNQKLAALAVMAETSGSHFDQVIEAIDKMVAVLKEEEESDLHIKEMCESDRARNTREAALKSRAMDELTDGITQLEAEIEQIKAEIKEKEEAVKATEEELAKATEIRDTENKEWQETDRVDKEAKDTVIKAKDVLANFYAENNLMLVQKQKRQPTVTAGEAPPPPPTTWDAPYGGKTDESTSIIAILEMITEDISKDIADAKASEDKAQAEYDSFKSESEAQIASLNEAITELTATQGEKEGEVTQKTEERTTNGEELDAVMKTMADAKPGCDFFAINYPVRLQNRQIELDGLDKAKAILTGASFNEAPDPNREIKPGDAFLVRRHKH